MVKKKNIQKIFSYVLILTLIIPLVFGGSVKVVQAASAASKAKAAYSAYLKKTVPWSYSSSMQPGDISFGLIDINNDRIPELYLRKDIWGKDYDYKLYGYIGGKVKCIYSFIRNSKLQKVYPSKDVFLVYGGYSHGIREYSYYQFNGKKVIPKVRKYKNMRVRGDSYYINDIAGNERRISKTKYIKEVRKLTSGRAKNGPKLYKNTSSNRKKYLENKK